MMRTQSFLARSFSFFVVVVLIVFPVGPSQAKGGTEQDQIILLNDSASALEETDPGLSRELTKFAEDLEKDWEAKNASKNVLPTPITDKYKLKVQYRIKILRSTIIMIHKTYPLIAKGLDQMVKDLSGEIGVKS